MKLRWSDIHFKCQCGRLIETGSLCYICECCDRRLCKNCGDIIKSLKEPSDQYLGYLDYIEIEDGE